MQLLLEIVDLQSDPHIVCDPVAIHIADPQTHLVLGQQLLTGDGHGGQPGIHEIRLHLHTAPPVVIGARLQHAHQLPVKVQPCPVVGGYLHLHIIYGRQPGKDIPGHIRCHLRGSNAHQLEGMAVLDAPEGMLPLGQGFRKDPVHKMQRQLLVCYLDGSSLLGNLRACQQGLQGAAAGGQRLVQLQHLHPGIPEQAIFSRFQQPHESAVLDEQASLIVLNDHGFHMYSSYRTAAVPPDGRGMIRTCSACGRQLQYGFARAARSAARGGRIRYPPPGRAAGMVPVCSRQRRRGTWIIRFFLVVHTAGGRHAAGSV